MDLIKENFLSGLWDKTTDIFESSVRQLDQNSKIFENEISFRLNEQMGKLCKQYQLTAKEPPRYVVISYLRSSLLDRYPWYEIDMYDKDYFYSDKEWSVWLEVPELSECLSRIMDIVHSEFQKQTRVEEYYEEEFLVTYGDKYHNWFMGHISSILNRHILSENWISFYSQNSICISFGEYKNQVIRIFDWSK